MILTDNQILEKLSKMSDQDKFEFAVIEHLKREKCVDLYMLSDFFFFCCDVLKIPDNTFDYEKSKRKIQYRLRKMKDNYLIDSRRTGTGFLGKTDFGATSFNSYTLPGYWL